jgi:hypothetical protein
LARSEAAEEIGSGFNGIGLCGGWLHISNAEILFLYKGE